MYLCFRLRVEATIMDSRWLVLPLVTLVALGCASGRARTVEAEPLQVPEPPPREVAAVPEPIEAAPEPIAAEPPPPPPAKAAPRPTRPTRPETAKPAASRPEPSPQPTTGVPAPAAPTPQPLGTPQTAREVEVERKIRESLSQASRTLAQINYSALSADSRTQYETSKGFITEAEEALKAKNYVFASYLADKAETLARGLK
jgi:outer membrane biosynthesis protein TonB